ncbi:MULTISPECIES: hypothetical protein [Sphingomonas]|jgi:hypothetical protein|uniref:hypothetical protein n=1 Tax=Sphingomonas TaxID=13687 RepID=UPI0010F8B063|nr:MULTISPECIES: hypothetical protein [Sphingomonas]
MAVSVTPETLHRLIREAEAERGRAASPTLKRCFAQLAAAYALELTRREARAATLRNIYQSEAGSSATYLR